MIRWMTIAVIAIAITTASDPAGAPVRLETLAVGADGNPSRDIANRMREPAVAVPSPLANALTVAPRLIRSRSAEPAYAFDRSSNGADELENALTPAAFVP